MLTEMWLPIESYEGFYSVSSHGRVMSHHGYRGAHILTPSYNKKGYSIVTLSVSGRRKTRTVHTLVMRTFRGAPPEGCEVNHINGIRDDNRLDNLEYVTSQQNQRHALSVLGKKDKLPRGKTHWRTSLTEDDVREIKRLLREGRLYQREIAAIFGVNTSNVEHIKAGNSWRHVE